MTASGAAVPSPERLARVIQPGEPVRPWLFLGPFYTDVSDRVHSSSLFESAATERGRGVVEEAVAAAAGVLCTMPREGDPAGFAGQGGAWRLVRRPEPMRSSWRPTPWTAYSAPRTAAPTAST